MYFLNNTRDKAQSSHAYPLRQSIHISMSAPGLSAPGAFLPLLSATHHCQVNFLKSPLCLQQVPAKLVSKGSLFINFKLLKSNSCGTCPSSRIPKFWASPDILSIGHLVELVPCIEIQCAMWVCVWWGHGKFMCIWIWCVVRVCDVCVWWWWGMCIEGRRQTP